jgi:hypothetical protein
MGRPCRCIDCGKCSSIEIRLLGLKRRDKEIATVTQFERKAVLLELAILALTLVVTVSLSFGIFYQTRNHFIIQRTTYMIERFNQKELVEARHRTEEWLLTKEEPKALLNRAYKPEGQDSDSGKTSAEQAKSEEARKDGNETVVNIVLVCNFFQELGTAMNHESLDEKYLWDVFGALVIDYGQKLRPFIVEFRIKKQRETLLQDFLLLVAKMKELDKKYRR